MNPFVYLFIMLLSVGIAEIPKIALQSQCLELTLNPNFPSHLYFMQDYVSPIQGIFFFLLSLPLYPPYFKSKQAHFSKIIFFPNNMSDH